MLGSNQRPPPCRGGALPAELIAREAASVATPLRCDPRVPGATLGARPATWRSGYAAACKAVYTGSIPVVALRGGEPATLDGLLFEHLDADVPPPGQRVLDPGCRLIPAGRVQGDHGGRLLGWWIERVEHLGDGLLALGCPELEHRVVELGVRHPIL